MAIKAMRTTAARPDESTGDRRDAPKLAALTAVNSAIERRRSSNNDTPAVIIASSGTGDRRSASCTIVWRPAGSPKSVLFVGYSAPALAACVLVDGCKGT